MAWNIRYSPSIVALPTNITRTPSAGTLSLTGQSPAVTDSGSGQLITWTAPTQNPDGTSLTDLAGFKVYYGTSSENPDNVKDVASSGATSTTISGLTSGTWYFTVVAYDTDGNESILSSQVSKTIP